MADPDDEGHGLGDPERRFGEAPRYLWHVVRTAVDYLALNTETGRDMMLRARPYPDPFVFSHLPAHAGAELGGWVGMRQDARPMILFVPGTFATKGASNTRKKVMRLFEETGAHLSSIDLRGFGHSADLRSTAGYLEARDVARIAEDFADDDRVTGILLAGESLGAATSLNAARRASDAVDGVLALNPFADLDWMIRLVSSKPPTWHPSNIVHHAFQTLLRHVTGDSTARFDAYLARVTETMGMTPAQLSYQASPRFHVGELDTPALVLHATDDAVIPSFHAHILEQAAQGNPNVRVHLTEMGGHASFDIWDEAWYWDTVDDFIDEVFA